jgi:hypothetical protein
MSVELHITLGVTVDREAWRDAYFISEKGLAGDVSEYVEQAVKDSAAAHFDQAITRVEIIKVKEVPA